MNEKEILDLIHDFAIDNKCSIEEASKTLIEQAKERLEKLQAEFKALKNEN